LREQSESFGACDGITARIDSQLAIDRARMRADRVGREIEALRDLARRHVGDQQPQHRELGLARGLEQLAVAGASPRRVELPLRPFRERGDPSAVAKLGELFASPTECRICLFESTAPTTNLGE
jgi:hypothetical protein